MFQKKYFPTISALFDHPKLRVHIRDGFEFLQKCALRARAVENGEDFNESLVTVPDVPVDGKFDVIITDSSELDEPGSPNEALFGEKYFKYLHDTLRPPHGILSSLGKHTN